MNEMEKSPFKLLTIKEDSCINLTTVEEKMDGVNAWKNKKKVPSFEQWAKEDSFLNLPAIKVNKKKSRFRVSSTSKESRLTNNKVEVIPTFLSPVFFADAKENYVAVCEKRRHTKLVSPSVGRNHQGSVGTRRKRQRRDSSSEEMECEEKENAEEAPCEKATRNKKRRVFQGNDYGEGKRKGQDSPAWGKRKGQDSPAVTEKYGKYASRFTKKQATPYGNRSFEDIMKGINMNFSKFSIK